jgi:hypothetical protein
MKISEVPEYTVTPHTQARMDADKAINALTVLTELGFITWHTEPFADSRWPDGIQTGIVAHGNILLTMLDIDGEEGFWLVNPVSIRAKEFCDSPALFQLAELVFKTQDSKC